MLKRSAILLTTVLIISESDFRESNLSNSTNNTSSSNLNYMPAYGSNAYNYATTNAEKEYMNNVTNASNSINTSSSNITYVPQYGSHQFNVEVNRQRVEYIRNYDKEYWKYRDQINEIGKSGQQYLGFDDTGRNIPNIIVNQSDQEVAINNFLTENISDKFLLSGTESKYFDNKVLKTLNIIESISVATVSAVALTTLAGMAIAPALFVGAISPFLIGFIPTFGALPIKDAIYRKKSENKKLEIQQSFNEIFGGSNNITTTYLQNNIIPKLDDPKYSELTKACSQSSPNVEQISKLITDKESYHIATTIMYTNLQNEYTRYNKMLYDNNLTTVSGALITSTIRNIRKSIASYRVTKIQNALNEITLLNAK